MAPREYLCPFSNQPLTFLNVGAGENAYCMVKSPFGWTSKLFPSEAKAKAWFTSSLETFFDINQATLVRVGEKKDWQWRSSGGWFSKLMMTREQAEEWFHTRQGKDSTKPRPSITINDDLPSIDEE